METQEMKPVFVRGYSRSGGTLLVTLLDAHWNIAMSYEQYPNMLVDEEGGWLSFARFRDWTRLCESAGGRKRVPKKFATFVVRWERSGIGPKELVRLSEGYEFGKFSPELDSLEAMAFIGYVADQKRKREGAVRWGMKCSNQYADYARIYPQAMFLNITRDCRDVAASQLNTGSFGKTAGEVAEGWVQTYGKFNQFAREAPERALQVRYEGLVQEPEMELRRICGFLGEEWDPAMLKHHEQDLTIFEVNHLSGQRINKPVDAAQIGRWKCDLSGADLAQIEEVAGDLLRELGYLNGEI